MLISLDASKPNENETKSESHFLPQSLRLGETDRSLTETEGTYHMYDLNVPELQHTLIPYLFLGIADKESILCYDEYYNVTSWTLEKPSEPMVNEKSTETEIYLAKTTHNVTHYIRRTSPSNCYRRVWSKWVVWNENEPVLKSDLDDEKFDFKSFTNNSERICAGKNITARFSLQNCLYKIFFTKIVQIAKKIFSITSWKHASPLIFVKLQQF